MRYKRLILLLLISVSVNAQYFSGEIEYDIKIIPKRQNLDLDSLWSLKHGKKVKYLITSNFYKSTYFNNNQRTYSYTYDNISKRMYDEYVNKPYITYRDSRRANFNYKKSKIFRDSVVNIMGKDCFIVKYESNYGKSTTFYSDEIKVDYESFKDHQVGNWYNKLREVDGCISIKTITEFEDYFEIQEAIKITPLELNQGNFAVGTDKIIVASYSALDKRVELVQPTKESIECYRKKLEIGKSKKVTDESLICYLSFVINKNGELSFPEPFEESNPELNKVAVDIIKNCGFKFNPGEIENRVVSSLVYFPIEF